MKLVHWVFVLTAVTCSTFISAKKLPAHFPRCHKVKNESQIPEFEKCFIDVLHEWRAFLKQGIPELRIPTLDPLIIPEISVVQNGTISFVLKLYNTSFEGLTDYVVNSFRYSMEPKMGFNGTAFIETLKLNGTYNFDGDFIGVRFGSDGPWQANFSDVEVTAWADEELYYKKDKAYLNVTSLDVSTKIGEANGQLENFFGNNDILNSALNDFINEFSSEIIEAMQPDIKLVMAQVLKAVKVQLTSKIPYDEFFLPD